MPHDTEVHGHGDGELLVIDREDVKNLNIDINMDRRVRSGGLQLLIIFGETPAQHTLQHTCNTSISQFIIVRVREGF